MSHRWLRFSDGLDVVFTGNETEAIEDGFVGNVYDLSLRRKKIKGILIMRSRFHNPFSLHGEKCVANCAHVWPPMTMKTRGSCTKIEIHSHELIDWNSIIMSSCEHRDYRGSSIFIPRSSASFSFREKRSSIPWRKEKKRKTESCVRATHTSRNLYPQLSHTDY